MLDRARSSMREEAGGVARAEQVGAEPMVPPTYRQRRQGQRRGAGG